MSDEFVSHHSPKWNRVKIENDVRSVIAKFSASTDVAWYKYPKLTLGQEGTFEIKDDVVVSLK